ncbi:hypothetical protein [Okeania sp.]|uniref:hypothetical protein n=1 Tax=Okeania sp. TaxID=3100323 RepID=UPI002B4B14E1|nr:hypothetical protein [Okeania sp.]MEB3343499.1 hypothetical protein [Okeania sp.]
MWNSVKCFLVLCLLLCLWLVQTPAVAAAKKTPMELFKNNLARVGVIGRIDGRKVVVDNGINQEKWFWLEYHFAKYCGLVEGTPDVEYDKDKKYLCKFDE